MHRTALLAVLAALTLSIMAMGRVGHVEEPPVVATPSVATPAVPKATAAEAERARTLLELRSQLGGSLLQGSILAGNEEESNTEAEFLQALESQLSASGCPDGTKDCEQRYQDSLNAAGELEEIPNRLPHLPARVNTARLPEIRTQTVEPDLSAILRTAGRHLDVHANDLEDMGDYQRGDEMRRLAERIRRVAREVRIETNGTTY